ncbi:MAG: hypothetical protein AAF585_23270, partial [Verrucomicrobiota bacterium]
VSVSGSTLRSRSNSARLVMRNRICSTKAVLDRPQIDAIVADLKEDGGGLRTLLEKAVASEIFQTP